MSCILSSFLCLKNKSHHHENKEKKSNYWEGPGESNSAMGCQGYNTTSVTLYQVAWKKVAKEHLIRHRVFYRPSLMLSYQLHIPVPPSWYVVSRDTQRIVWHPRIQLTGTRWSKILLRVPVKHILFQFLGSFQGSSWNLVIVLIIWVHHPPSVEFDSCLFLCLLTDFF